MPTSQPQKTRESKELDHATIELDSKESKDASATEQLTRDLAAADKNLEILLKEIKEESKDESTSLCDVMFHLDKNKKIDSYNSLLKAARKKTQVENRLDKIQGSDEKTRKARLESSLYEKWHTILQIKNNVKPGDHLEWLQIQMGPSCISSVIGIRRNYLSNVFDAIRKYARYKFNLNILNKADITFRKMYQNKVFTAYKELLEAKEKRELEPLVKSQEYSNFKLTKLKKTTNAKLEYKNLENEIKNKEKVIEDLKSLGDLKSFDIGHIITVYNAHIKKQESQIPEYDEIKQEEENITRISLNISQCKKQHEGSKKHFDMVKDLLNANVDHYLLEYSDKQWRPADSYKEKLVDSIKCKLKANIDDHTTQEKKEALVKIIDTRSSLLATLVLSEFDNYENETQMKRYSIKKADAGELKKQIEEEINDVINSSTESSINEIKQEIAKTGIGGLDIKDIINVREETFKGCEIHLKKYLNDKFSRYKGSRHWIGFPSSQSEDLHGWISSLRETVTKSLEEYESVKMSLKVLNNQFNLSPKSLIYEDYVNTNQWKLYKILEACFPGEDISEIVTFLQNQVSIRGEMNPANIVESATGNTLLHLTTQLFQSSSSDASCQDYLLQVMITLIKNGAVICVKNRDRTPAFDLSALQSPTKRGCELLSAILENLETFSELEEEFRKLLISGLTVKSEILPQEATILLQPIFNSISSMNDNDIVDSLKKFGIFKVTTPDSFLSQFVEGAEKLFKEVSEGKVICLSIDIEKPVSIYKLVLQIWQQPLTHEPEPSTLKNKIEILPSPAIPYTSASASDTMGKDEDKTLKRTSPSSTLPPGTATSISTQRQRDGIHLVASKKDSLNQEVTLEVKKIGL